MSVLVYTVLSVFAAILALALAVGLWRIVRALLAGEAALARRFVLPCLRFGLWLAGTVVLRTAHGRGFRLAILLNMAAVLLGLAHDWPVLRTSLGPHRNKPAA